MKWVAIFVASALGVVLLSSSSAQAQTLRVQPLEYRTSLAKGEVQKGFIDISNLDTTPVIIRIHTQAFKQINDDGTLQFYDNEIVSQGVMPDLEEFELGPKEAIRMFFLVDGAKLPSGDVFAVIFATAHNKDVRKGVSHSVRAGTLLNIVNGTPGSREADITHMTVPFFQFGERITGSYVIKNRANKAETTGFYPEVKIAINPFYNEKKVTSKLIFAGNSRTNEFAIVDDRFGVYEVTASYGDSSRSQWAFIVTGVWRWVSVAVLVALLGGSLLFGFFYRRHRNKPR